MNVIVCCETSGVVATAFRRHGHVAYSCDTRPTTDPRNERYHEIGDYEDALWRFIHSGFAPDIIIGHPPCTALSTSGNRWYVGTPAREDAIQFVIHMAALFTEHARIGWAIENPIGVLSNRWRKPSQYIQPWQFGHPEQKKTGLWLEGLPKLRPTKILPEPACGYWENQTPRRHNKVGETKDRADRRSRTYEGIADAMASQWGGLR